MPPIRIGLNPGFFPINYPSRPYANVLDGGAGFTGPVDANGMPLGDSTVDTCSGSNNTGNYDFYIDAYHADVVVPNGNGLTAVSPAPMVRDPATGLLKTSLYVFGDSTAGVSIVNTRREASDTTATGIKGCWIMAPDAIGSKTSVPFGQRWHPLNLAFYKRFAYLRVLNYVGTNGIQGAWPCPEIEYDSLPKPNETAFGARTMPIEHMVDLCNTLGCDLWFPMPDLWSQACQLRAIETIFNGSPGWPGLKPNLRVYLSYSNESNFNFSGGYNDPTTGAYVAGSFPQTQRIYDRAQAEYAAGGSDLAWNDGSYYSGYTATYDLLYKWNCRGVCRLWDMANQVRPGGFNRTWFTVFDSYRGRTDILNIGLSYAYRIARQNGLANAAGRISFAGGSFYTNQLPVPATATGSAADQAFAGGWEVDNWTAAEVAALAVPEYVGIGSSGYEGNWCTDDSVIARDPRGFAQQQAIFDNGVKGGRTVFGVYWDLGTPWQLADSLADLTHPKNLGTTDRINFYNAGPTPVTQLRDLQTAAVADLSAQAQATAAQQAADAAKVAADAKVAASSPAFAAALLKNPGGIAIDFSAVPPVMYVASADGSSFTSTVADGLDDVPATPAP